MSTFIGTSSAPNCSADGFKASSGKRRMLNNGSLKRRFEPESEAEDLAYRRISDESAGQRSKRSRFDSRQQVIDLHGASTALHSRPSSSNEQRAWSSPKFDYMDVEMQEDIVCQESRPCSLWMNIQGDIEIESNTTKNPSSSSFTSTTPSPSTSSATYHQHIPNNLFQLTVSTPTGHPHPYALGTPSSSRFKLDGYFDVIR